MDDVRGQLHDEWPVQPEVMPHVGRGLGRVVVSQEHLHRIARGVMTGEKDHDRRTEEEGQREADTVGQEADHVGPILANTDGAAPDRTEAALSATPERPHAPRACAISGCSRR